LKPSVNRRDFLRRIFAGPTGAVAGNLKAVATGAVAKGTVAQTKSLTIIDTHTHFYDPTRAEGVPWPPKDDSLLYRRVLPEHYRALKKPAEVTGTVVIEASPRVEDNQWILDLAAGDPFITGFVGNLPVGDADFMRHLNDFSHNPIFRGIRLSEDRLTAGLSTEPFMGDLRLLADYGLSLDVVGGPSMLSATATLAKEIPHLRIIIDHVAGAKVDGHAVQPDWHRGMAQAAHEPNVFCKVSGLVEGTGRTDKSAPKDLGFYIPVLDSVWDMFGEDRLSYGSNWPVSERFATCETVQQIVTDYFQTKGLHASQKFFSRNAGNAYNWLHR
jgi:predicted TIM-barrel fold metal-dependent hydrolase